MMKKDEISEAAGRLGPSKMMKIDSNWTQNGPPMVLRPEIGVSDRAEAHGSSGLVWKGYIWSKKLIYCGLVWKGYIWSKKCFKQNSRNWVCLAGEMSGDPVGVFSTIQEPPNCHIEFFLFYRFYRKIRKIAYQRNYTTHEYKAGRA